MGKLFNFILNVQLGILWVMSILFHAWTAIIAFQTGGWIMGIISFVFPVFSECYWVIRAWAAYGIDSSYMQWLIVLVVGWCAYYAATFLYAIFTTKK